MKNYRQKVFVFALLGCMLLFNPSFGQKEIQPSNPALQDQDLSTQGMELPDCEQATAQIDLNVNNVNARLLNGGDLWWDGSDGRYIVPKPENGEPEVSAIFAGGFWMGGFDVAGGLKVAAQTYGTLNGTSDYWPGPIGPVTEEDCIDFDRFWSTNSEDINAHITDWEDNGTIDNTVPLSILSWPGPGNPHFFDIHGFELPEGISGLAPFYDQDQDSFYEPMEGDYPDINEADQGIWWVFNDARGIHTESSGDPLNFTVQALAYAYSSANSNINNATFYNYKFTNHSIQQLDSAYVAFWVDPDLGCYLDDYAGCDTTQNMAYVYNMDALDGVSSCTDCSGVNTYCEEIPMLGIKMLRGVFGIENNELVDQKMSSFMPLNNGGNPPFPLEAPERYYALMSGSWPDGTRLTKGGTGYNPGSTDYTNYAFPSSPDDPDGWSMCSENTGAADIRFVIGSGPYSMVPGGVAEITFAVIFVEDIPHPCPDLSLLTEAANDVEELFYGLTSGIDQLVKEPPSIIIQPNPMTEQAELIYNDLENQVLEIGIYSVDGKQVQLYKNISGNSLTINRNNLPGGLYFYKLLTDDFKIHSGKFIVQ